MGVFHHQDTPKSWLSSFIIIFPTKVISFLSIPNFRIQPHHLMGVSLEWLNHLRITEMKRLQSGAETITGTMREILWRVGHFFKCVVDFHCSFHSNHGTHEIARFRFYGVFGCFSTNCSPTRLCFVMFCVHVIGSLENTNSRKGKALTAL